MHRAAQAFQEVLGCILGPCPGRPGLQGRGAASAQVTCQSRELPSAGVPRALGELCCPVSSGVPWATVVCLRDPSLLPQAGSREGDLLLGRLMKSGWKAWASLAAREAD